MTDWKGRKVVSEEASARVQARDDKGLNLGSGEGERRLVTNGT